jgi:SSS family solute:Na+ symporter
MGVFLLVLSLYAALVLLIGTLGLRRVRSGEDFWVARRGASGLAIGGSLAATIVGGSSTLGLAGLGYSRGLTGSWWLLCGVGGLGGLLWLLRARHCPVATTLPELIGRWYGPGLRRLAALCIAAAWLGIVGAQANAAGRILTAFLGGRTLLWCFLAGALFIFYTAAGGQLSVIRTDLFQALVILAGTGACAGAGLARAGGFRGLAGALPAGHLSFPLSPAFSPLELALLLLTVGSTYLTGPDMLSRVFCARGPRAARAGVAVALCFVALFAWLPTLIGLEARVLLPPGDPEGALPLLARTLLSPGLAALTMAALLSAFMSSADTTLLTMSAVLALDLFPGRRPGASAPGAGAGGLAGWRLIVVLSGTAAVLVGAMSGGIIGSLLVGYTIFSGGLFVPIVAGLAGKPMSRPAAWCAAAAGGTLALAGRLLHLDPLIAASFLLSFTVLLADRLRLPARAAPRRGAPRGGGGDP